MQTLISIVITGAAAFFAVGAVWLVYKERQDKIKAEKELEEVLKNEKNMAETFSQANAIKTAAISGDIDSDFNYMANKLHDYAAD